MEFWEFLIQKEGDRSWLPLESPSIEIEAGRYRVVARSSRAHTATEVRVTHYAVNENPPVRRVRKRSSQTNTDGLIVILPFTRLQPGVWELRCTGDVMAEMMGENWRYTAQLEVVAAEVPSVVPVEPESVALEPVEPEPVALEPDAIPAVTAAEATEEATEIDQPVAAVPDAITAADSPMVMPADAPDSPFTEPVGVPADPVPDLTANTPIEAPEAPRDTAAPEHSEPAVTQTQSSPSSAQLAEVLQQIERHSEELVNAAFQELANLDDLPEDEAASPLEPVVTQADSPPTAPQLHVVLEQETYIIQRGEVVALAGRIEFPADPTLDQATLQSLRVSELRVRLYDPQTSQILMDEVYPIDHRVPPFPFSGTVSLPEHYQTYLVLGELIFQGSAAGGELQVLATRSFNVTTDLHELIESIANDFPDVEALPPEAQIPEIAEPLPAAELERLNAQPKFKRSTQSLPPQLRQPDPTRTHASLELPTFVKPQAPQPEPALAKNSQSATPSESTSQPEEVSTSAADLEPLAVSLPIASPSQQEADTSELANGSIQADLSLLGTEPSPEAQTIPDTVSDQAKPNDSADLFPGWDEISGRVPIWKQRQPRRPVDSSNAPEDVSFRALNLQDRFWTRLQSLATNPDLSANLVTETAELTGGADLTAAPLAHVAELATRKQQAFGLDADLTAHEIVVDDEPPPITTTLHTSAPEPPADLSLSPILPEDEPIPTPRLQLPSGELTADQPILLTVKLPNLLARVYVKLWLRDRQTRELLGTPRWIIDFVPDGFGNQMARTEIVVPPGCLKVQFEAIAVEIATQRESDKTTMTRPVIPPDLSPFSLDKLEI